MKSASEIIKAEHDNIQISETFLFVFLDCSDVLHKPIFSLNQRGVQPILISLGGSLSVKSLFCTKKNKRKK